ncbi:MAG: transglutaminase-like domain-containing protein, partial [Myxococcota bacterium]
SAPPATTTVSDDVHLEATTYVDAAHPRIVATAQRIVGGAANDRERAILLHDFVRDEIRFGFAPRFWDQTASEVLESGVGFCNTKSTLFVALLRAVGIPARQSFVTIDARILDGVIDPRTAYVDHSFAEVSIDGEWIKTDSYIVDRTLARVARAQLREQGRVIGLGVHVNGVSDWDGRSDAFSQFVDDGTLPNLSTRNHGVYPDVGAFARSGKAKNVLRGPAKWFFGFFARAANRRADAIRSRAIVSQISDAR